MKTAREVCRAAGISRKALRVYRERKLLSPGQKSVQGYWLYGDDALVKLRRIQLLKRLGFKLSEIRELDRTPHPEFSKILAVKKNESEQEMQALQLRMRLIAAVETELGSGAGESGLSPEAVERLMNRFLEEKQDPQEE